MHAFSWLESKHATDGVVGVVASGVFVALVGFVVDIAMVGVVLVVVFIAVVVGSCVVGFVVVVVVVGSGVVVLGFLLQTTSPSHSPFVLSQMTTAVPSSSIFA